MPSNPDSRIEFRDLNSKTTIKSLFPTKNTHQIVKALLAHILEDKKSLHSLGLEVCPICDNPFDQCEYFQRIEDE